MRSVLITVSLAIATMFLAGPAQAATAPGRVAVSLELLDAAWWVNGNGELELVLTPQIIAEADQHGGVYELPASGAELGYATNNPGGYNLKARIDSTGNEGWDPPLKVGLQIQAADGHYVIGPALINNGGHPTSGSLVDTHGGPVFSSLLLRFRLTGVDSHDAPGVYKTSVMFTLQAL